MKYVGTYSNPKDIVTKDKLEAVASRVSTNEDNIAMAESDIDGLQTTVGTLQTNVNNVQTALTSKQDAIVGAASTITEDNLATDRALVSNSSGKVAVSNVTSTELGYLDGVTSNVQTQLNKKLEKAPVTSVNSKTGAVQLNASDVGALPDTTVIPTKTSQLDNDSGFITDIPIASATQLGGVKVGTGLSVTENGVLSATGGGTADAVEWNNVLDKPTTIAGYGITDAKIENDTITLGTNSIKPYGATNPPPYPVTSVNGQTGAVTVDVDLPEHLVKYQPLAPVEATTLVNADTLQGHDATYFAKQSDVNTINSQVSTNTSNISTLQSGLSTVNANIANKLDKSGGTMTGPLVAKSGINLTIAQVRNIIISTEEPSAEVGSNGDIWIRYTE